MANWNGMRTEVGRAANKAIKKTGEVADVAAVYVKIKMAEAKMDGYYTTLGKLTYKQLKTGESQAEKIKPIVDGIDTCRAKISALKAKLEEEKQRRKDEREAAKNSDIADIEKAVEEAGYTVRK
jgi:hypothetical protein